MLIKPGNAHCTDHASPRMAPSSKGRPHVTSLPNISIVDSMPNPAAHRMMSRVARPVGSAAPSEQRAYRVKALNGCENRCSSGAL